MNYDYSEVKKQICVLIGAGMSAGAGIPTFRGKGGSWETDKKVRQAFGIDRYMHDADSRKLLWRWLAKSPAWSAKPTRAHWALKKLDDAGYLVSIETQNFDMLEKKAGIRQGKIHNLHGRLTKSLCMDCGRYFDTKPFCGELNEHPDPHCPDCGGVIRPDIVFFGEPLDQVMLDKISGIDLQKCDEIWCVGSSLEVYPAAGLPIIAKQAGKKVIIVSTDKTQLDELADQIIRQPANVAVPALVDTIVDTDKDILY